MLDLMLKAVCLVALLLIGSSAASVADYFFERGVLNAVCAVTYFLVFSLPVYIAGNYYDKACKE